jgi:hypothetical protein
VSSPTRSSAASAAECRAEAARHSRAARHRHPGGRGVPDRGRAGTGGAARRHPRSVRVDPDPVGASPHGRRRLTVEDLPGPGLGPALGPLGAGGLYPRNVSLEQLHKTAGHEDRALLSPTEQVAYDFRNLRSDLTQAVKDQLGFKAIKPILAKQLNLLEERATARAKLGKNPTSLQKFEADVRLIVRHGWADKAKARRALKWARC